MSHLSYIVWILLLPLANFALLGLTGRKLLKGISGVIGTSVLLVVAALASMAVYQYFFVYGKLDGIYHLINVLQFEWLKFSPNVSIGMGVALDPISVMMLFIVSVVSLMVHVFSLGYMKGEERFGTYYAFLSLFTFSMLSLVISTNIFQIYIFWELVGISSYLLIGFYYDKPSAVAASKKAFIVTRFADLGFLVGILILSFGAGTLDIHTLIIRLTTVQSPQLLGMTTSSFLGISALTWGLTLVFIGGAGKSAMFPLHVWLPDAMEGPTPISALIHAATMVVAGVYLVARLFPLYSFDVSSLNIVAYVGAISALLPAIIACTQNDIKRVLAYSTISQIGYMMFGLGVSGYSGELGLGYMASMFHLFTHAFFKSLLFLCAGAIIHLVQSNDVKDMGGLRKLMPITHIAFLVGCLSIAGIPPFSGFFSKEEILSAAYQSNKLIYGVGVFTSMLTAFYMFRLYFRIFHSRAQNRELAHGEGSLSMKLPLVVLAVSATLAGFVPFSLFVTPDHAPIEAHVDLIFSIFPVVLSVAAILFAARLYRTQNARPAKIATSLGKIYRFAYRKFYFDEIYLFVSKKIIFNLIGRPAAWIDKHIVDGLMNLLAATTVKISVLIKGFQSGKLQNYAVYFFAGIIGLAALFVYFRQSP
ncbi:MAG TPA: NADH-quinone oxidoreductase subunit L [Puia sp.]|nr:NADH-quinone oxidoreductase subunit L [Puia sp.]